jgi:TolB-like protein
VKILAPEKPPAKLTKTRLLSGIVISATIFAIFVLIAFPKIFHINKNKVSRDADGKISIAVNIFENLTGDTTLNPWCQGISELLINKLGSSKDLSLQNSQTLHEVYQSIDQTKKASVVPSLSREAAIRLRSGAYITGNFQKTENKIRILVKLIDKKVITFCGQAGLTGI